MTTLKKITLPAHPLLVAEFKGHTGFICDLDFDVNGKYLASCSDGEVLFRGVRYSGVYAIQGCTLFRGVRYSGVYAIQGCTLFRGVRYSGVYAIQGCTLFREPFVQY